MLLSGFGLHPSQTAAVCGFWVAGVLVNSLFCVLLAYVSGRCHQLRLCVAWWCIIVRPQRHHLESLPNCDRLGGPIMVQVSLIVSSSRELVCQQIRNLVFLLSVCHIPMCWCR